MSVRATFALAVVVGLLAVFVFYDETPTGDAGAALSLAAPQGSTGAAASGRLLFDFATSDITRVNLSDNDLDITLDRPAGVWRNPRAGHILESVLADLAALRTLDEIPTADAALPDYGLQPPRLTLTLDLAGRTSPFVLHIGNHNPSATSVYARFGNEGPIYVAGSLVEWKLRTALRQIGRGANEES